MCVKKLLFGAVLTAFLIFSASAWAAEDVQGQKDTAFQLLIGVDETVLVDAPSPYYEKKTLMVPLRSVSEALGYQVTWQAGLITVDDDYTQKAVLRCESNEVGIIGKLKVIDLSRQITMAEAVSVDRGKAFVPLEFFREFFNETNIAGQQIFIAPQMAELHTAQAEVGNEMETTK